MASEKNKKRLTVGTVVTIISILAIISVAKDGLDLITEYILPKPDATSEVDAASAIQTQIAMEPTLEQTTTAPVVQNPVATTVLIEPIRLTRQIGNEVQPSFSNDGRFIVFTADGDGNLEIYTMHSDGLIRQRRTNNDLGEDVPTFSPDGQKILFGASHEGNGEIYLLDLDGSQRIVNISNVPESDEGRPRFTVGGNSVVFDSSRSGNWEIYIAEFQNGALVSPKRLTNRPEYQDRYPVISALGDLVYFRAGADFDDVDVKSKLYSVQTDGSNLRVVTDGPNDRYPTIAASGDWIVFSSDRDGNYELYALHTESGELKRLTHHQADDSFPSFSKDGHWIVFASNRGDTGYDIYKMPFSDTN